MLEPLPLVVLESAADTEKGRGAQLSRGSAAAIGEVLLFLHADTRLPTSWDATAISTLLPPGVAAWDQVEFWVCGNHFYVQKPRRHNIRHCISAQIPILTTSTDKSRLSVPTRYRKIPPQVAAGAFRFGIDPQSVVDAGASWLARAQLYVLTRGTNLRAEPYGDQALFALSSTMQRAGGWRSDHPLLEDVELVRRLTATEGRVVITDDSANTSARRFLRHGVMYVMACNQYVLARYALGDSPKVLAAWYYGK